jgi:ABC-type polysaccharide/polyol phosphate export permease
MYSRAFYTREQLFNDRFPLSVVAILAIIQMLTTFAIVALEAAHIVISLRLTNLFAGFWTSIPFTILWISMFATGKSFIKEYRLLCTG